MDLIWTQDIWDSRLLLWALGWGLVSLFFLSLWFIEVKTSDATFVDTGWALSFSLLSVLYGLLGSGYRARSLLMCIVVIIWSWRLTCHLYFRHTGTEDARYQKIRKNQGKNAHRFYFFFYQAQSLSAAILSVPFLLIAFNTSPTFHMLELLGWTLCLLATIGETIADQQLRVHRNQTSNAGKTCRIGLWHYSRHPNYFFEWLIWCGYALVCLPAPAGLIGLASPGLMLLFIIKVTGIPPTEEQALRSRGQDYKQYQESTSAFVPWFPKKEAP